MAKRPLLTHGELLLITGSGIPVCLSFHPGPDPKKDPLGWRPLCGRRPPSSINPATIYEEPV